jgi:hypothetical protein
MILMRKQYRKNQPGRSGCRWSLVIRWIIGRVKLYGLTENWWTGPLERVINTEVLFVNRISMKMFGCRKIFGYH